MAIETVPQPSIPITTPFRPGLGFLTATPIIAAAGLLEVPLLLAPGVPVAEYLAGAVLAAIAAYLSARFLIRYFRSGRLDPYGWYCVAFGIASLLLLR